MTKRIGILAVLFAGVATFHSAFAGGDAAAAKEALQALNEYIGSWKGSGTSEKERSDIWKEAGSWSWRFKGKDAWLTLDLKDDKRFKGGELRYLPARERYEFTATDKDGKQHVFEGELKKNKLSLTRVDPATKETQQLQMNTAGGGDRLILTYAVKPENRTLFSKQYQVAMTREGVSFAAASKKNECIVTGGLGTMAVSFKGITYYVCCSGCRDAFNENPEKFVKEFQAKKKGGR